MISRTGDIMLHKGAVGLPELPKNSIALSPVTENELSNVGLYYTRN